MRTAKTAETPSKAIEARISCREAIGERTRDALRHKRSQGHRVGNIPFGSRLAADGQHLEADAAEQAALREIRRLRGEGRSLRGIAAALNGRA